MIPRHPHSVHHNGPSACLYDMIYYSIVLASLDLLFYPLTLHTVVRFERESDARVYYLSEHLVCFLY